MYLFADLALVFPMVVLIPAILPRTDLTPGRPESDLLARSVLVSVYGHSVILIAFQVLASHYLHAQVSAMAAFKTAAGARQSRNSNVRTVARSWAVLHQRTRQLAGAVLDS